MTPMQMSAPLTRRTFLADLGRGGFALAVFTVLGCGPASSSATSSASAATSVGSVPSGDAGTSAAASEPAAASAAASAGAGGAVTWERVNLGFVSAYLLVRGGEAVVVDTGTVGSEDAIEGVLGDVGLDWGAVGHVIFTHLHGDHAGSSDAVLTAAAAATGYAGEADIPGIAAPRPLTAVGDGDRVFDLGIVATPGHTAGSISVFDEVGGIFVAGDALGTDGGAPTPPAADFTDDMDLALQSVGKIGGLTFDTLLVGHGDPITSGASAAVAALSGG
jgi:glyoxylase-like metal-dependent hydrolase (beta-lactamase superfamily II)